MVSFWIFFVLLCFAIPAALLVMSLLLPRSEKLGYPKYWYVLSVISGLWILAAGVLAIVLISAPTVII